MPIKFFLKKNIKFKFKFKKCLRIYFCYKSFFSFCCCCEKALKKKSSIISIKKKKKQQFNNIWLLIRFPLLLMSNEIYFLEGNSWCSMASIWKSPLYCAFSLIFRIQWKYIKTLDTDLLLFSFVLLLSTGSILNSKL